MGQVRGRGRRVEERTGWNCRFLSDLLIIPNTDIPGISEVTTDPGTACASMPEQMNMAWLMSAASPYITGNDHTLGKKSRAMR